MPMMSPRERILHAVNPEEPDRVPLNIADGVALAAVHNIQPDVVPEKLLNAADATRRFGRHPISA